MSGPPAPELVVLLSHNGFDVDRKVARTVKGIDVLLSGHTHDAVLEPIKVDKTLIVATAPTASSYRASISMCKKEIKSFRYMPPCSPTPSSRTPRRPRWSPGTVPPYAEISRVLGRTQSCSTARQFQRHARRRDLRRHRDAARRRGRLSPGVAEARACFPARTSPSRTSPTPRR